MVAVLVFVLVGVVSNAGVATTAAKPAPKFTGQGSPAVVEQMTPGSVLKRTAEGPHAMTYHVYVPTTFTAAKPPPIAIVFSPGGSGSGMMGQLKASAEKAGWLVVGCDKLKNSMEKEGVKGKEEEDMEDEVLNDIFLSIPCQTNRVYLGGMSGGALRAYWISSRRKESFAGILAYGGWLGGQEKQNKLKCCKGMAVAIINGESDKNANTWVAGDSAALRRRNCRIKNFPFPGGHVVAPTEITDKVIAWMEEDWTKTGSKRK
jgi:poly(3-hydroxybutyrate) depolymerase